MYFEYDENYNQRTIIQIMIDGRAKFELNDSITTSYYWDFNQSIWIIAGQSKSKTESNNEGDIVSRSQYSRSNSEESWEPGTRTEFYYNSAGNILSESIFRWDPNSPQWAPSQNEYTYNEFGNELSISDQYGMPPQVNGNCITKRRKSMMKIKILLQKFSPPIRLII